jgi:hypothetical protein
LLASISVFFQAQESLLGKRYRVLPKHRRGGWFEIFAH